MAMKAQSKNIFELEFMIPTLVSNRIHICIQN